MANRNHGIGARHMALIDCAMDILVDEARDAAKHGDTARLERAYNAALVYSKRAGVQGDERVGEIRDIYESAARDEKVTRW